MKIVEWIKPEAQMARLGRHQWAVPRLFELARNLPVMDVVIDHMSTYFVYEKLTLRELIAHMKAVEAADLSYPIILDEDGELMDGRHRLMKAIMQGHATIKAVRFDENPSPCRVDE
jgi:hypothetical protein